MVRHSKGRPSAADIRRTLQVVDYRLLTLRSRYLIKKKAGVEIDCNGIAQGFTSDVLGRFLAARGIRNYLVDVGGELVAAGVNAQGKPWSVGIERPGGDSSRPMQAVLQLNNRAVATSGNYRRFFDEGGTRFAHTIHPRTGEALHNNIITVTVTAPDAITADAYDNALILLGVEAGLSIRARSSKLGLGAFMCTKTQMAPYKEKYVPRVFFPDRNKKMRPPSGSPSLSCSVNCGLLDMELQSNVRLYRVKIRDLLHFIRCIIVLHIGVEHHG